jgi:hypothetical protein
MMQSLLISQQVSPYSAKGKSQARVIIQQQQHSLLSQASWDRLEMKPKRDKKQGGRVIIMNLNVFFMDTSSNPNLNVFFKVPQSINTRMTA